MGQTVHAKTSKKRPSMMLRMKRFRRVLQRALSKNPQLGSLYYERGSISSQQQTDFNGNS